MTNIERARFKGNLPVELVLKFPCPQKILMVTDGALDFGTGGFGLSEFVSIVQGAGHTVSTAHRSGDINATIPVAFQFNTASTEVSTANYDQIWLFGFSTTPLTNNEQITIASFMKSGGGVFATGDHGTLGAGMGGNLPRVRSMRNWSTIPMSNPNRLDTVLDPGTDNIKQFDDQADAIAQRIFPIFFSNGGADTVASSWNVHPVLRYPSGVVDYLPDHAHESECLAPIPVAGNFAGIEEWPAPVAGGARIAPHIAAVSVSAGRFITDSLKPPVYPRCFGAISTYDGDAANVGRIVCDATWHHFVNINLNGTGSMPDSTGLLRKGLYSAGGTPTPEYQKIQRYFLNTARWLAPKHHRFCWPFIQAVIARFDFEVAELGLPNPHPCPWEPLIRIGQIVEDTLTQQWGPGTMADLVDDLLSSTDTAPTLARLLKAQQYPQGEDQRKREAALLPVQDLRRAVLGSVVNLLAQELPTELSKLESLLQDNGLDRLAPKLIEEGIRGAEQSIHDYLQREIRMMNSLFKAMQTEQQR